MVPSHRVFLACTASLMLLSCVSKYSLDRQMQSGVIPPNAWIYVSVPESGRYGNYLYEASGWQTRDAVAQAFIPHVARVLVAKRVEPVDVARASARAETATHLVFSEIKHWEDRATEWSGLPDRITIQIRIYEVDSGKLLDSAEVSGKSRWATFGGDHPQDLLDRAVGDYVDLLFSGGRR